MSSLCSSLQGRATLWSWGFLLFPDTGSLSVRHVCSGPAGGRAAPGAMACVSPLDQPQGLPRQPGPLRTFVSIQCGEDDVLEGHRVTGLREEALLPPLGPAGLGNSLPLWQRGLAAGATLVSASPEVTGPGDVSATGPREHTGHHPALLLCRWETRSPERGGPGTAVGRRALPPRAPTAVAPVSLGSPAP